MKNIFVVSAVLLSILVAGKAQAGFKTVADAEKKLSEYSVADIDGDQKRLEEEKKLKIDEIYDDLDDIVELLKKEKLTEDLAVQIERACLLASLHDPTNYAVEIILPVYDKNKDLFKKASERLHPFDRKNIMDTLKAMSKNAVEGNG